LLSVHAFVWIGWGCMLSLSGLLGLLGFLYVFLLASRVAVAYGLVSTSEMYYDSRQAIMPLHTPNIKL
jgi:hypothetical protein